MDYQYIVTDDQRVVCVRNIERFETHFLCEENRITSWMPENFPNHVAIFKSESVACKYAIDWLEAKVRALTIQKMQADDREADEAKDQESMAEIQKSFQQ